MTEHVGSSRSARRRVVADRRLGANLDHADRIYNGINTAIDKHIAALGIAAPAPPVANPCGSPTEERRTLNLRSANITTVLWCIGV